MFNQFTQQYNLSKTLRFELKPVGETASYIGDFESDYLKTLVVTDEQRASDYQAIKLLIDDYHRDYIEKCLAEPVDKKTGEILFSATSFDEAFVCFKQLKVKGDIKDKENSKKAWKKCQETLRKKLIKAFTDKDKLFKKEFITTELPRWLQQNSHLSEENEKLVAGFNKFTTYFTGFNDNRKNMYTDKEQTTAIAYRLINDNLAKFFDNCLNYSKICANHPDIELSAADELLENMQVKSLVEIFNPTFFIRLFTQQAMSGYNELLGGKTEENGTKIQGLNEKLNLYRQQHKDAAGKAVKIPFFIQLYKQILSDRQSSSFIPEAFDDDQQMLQALKIYVQQSKALLSQLDAAMDKLPQADLSKVYVKNDALSAVSKRLYDDYRIIPLALDHYVDEEVYPAPTTNKITNKLLKQREAHRKQDVFSIAELQRASDSYLAQLDKDAFTEKVTELTDTHQPLLAYFEQALTQTKTTVKLNELIASAAPLFELESLNHKRIAPKNNDDKGSKGFLQLQKIQAMLDGFKALADVAKPLHLVKGRKQIEVTELDTGFYADFAKSYEDYSDLTINLYNKVRNHLTKKASTTNKIKINFDNATLLNGWDINKETDNTSVILRKDGHYYLAIMPPKHNKIFTNYPQPTATESCYEKVNYKLLSGASKTLPKVFLSTKGIANYQPSTAILDLYDNDEHKKGDTFKLASCHRLIDYFKSNIATYKAKPTDEFGWEVFNFKFSPTKNYKDLSDFYKEVDNQGYKLWFSDIAVSYIDEQVQQGKLFLFEIYNKDFSAFSKGRPNLHTLYWKGLFDENNLRDVVLKLNGEAEMFYRQHSIKHDETTIHPKNQAIPNKNANNPKKASQFDYDLVKDKRYTKDKFFFHVPITLNFKSTGVAKFNDKINQHLAASSGVNVIGIDRGERHLLYYTIINQQGQIIAQDSLNEIATDQGYSVDYQQKLGAKEKARDEARKSWSSIDNIKDLKAGYLSHIVHKLATLIIKYNAIVCLEDLNFGFKRGRFKVEKQVYQNFEKALINKLNYLVFKQQQQGEAGHFMNAYQLTAPFVSFDKLGKQSGILFYVAAAYTSKIDPVTSFINFLKPQYESLAKSKLFFEKMDSIRLNTKTNYFEFSFDYDNFPIKQDLSKYQSKWTVCTHGDTRYQNKRDHNGQWHTEVVNVSEQLRQLFSDAGIGFSDGQELKQAIIEKKDSKFYKKLLWLLKLTLSLRHSKTGTDDDFILSPVANAKGEFFNSTKATSAYPKDADANGAYHIALKGLWNLQQIDDWDGNKKLNLAMKNADWFEFALNKPFNK